jgi:hypothetical protein
MVPKGAPKPTSSSQKGLVTIVQTRPHKSGYQHVKIDMNSCLAPAAADCVRT